MTLVGQGGQCFSWCNCACWSCYLDPSQLGHCLHVVCFLINCSVMANKWNASLNSTVCVRTCICVWVAVKFNRSHCKNAPACIMCPYGADTHVQISVLTTCVQLYESKIFIYLAETVFIAGNVEEFLVYFLTLPWCLLCLPVELWLVYLCAYSWH